MRQQYHSRQTSNGLLVWDVRRLVELTRGFPEITIPLTKIEELDENFWFHGRGSEVSCRDVADHAKLIQDTDLRYPIILSAEGRVMDGMHRVAKAYMEGRSEIKAVQFPENPTPDYIDVDIESLPYDDAL